MDRQDWLGGVEGGGLAVQANAARRHHIPKQRHRATNSAAYDAVLRQHGSLTFWFAEQAIAAWRAEHRTTRGGQPYSGLSNCRLQLFKDRDHVAWQTSSGYNWRSLIEADVSRFKRVIGDGLRSRADWRGTTEVAIAVSAVKVRCRKRELRFLWLGSDFFSRLLKLVLDCELGVIHFAVASLERAIASDLAAGGD